MLLLAWSELDTTLDHLGTTADRRCALGTSPGSDVLGRLLVSARAVKAVAQLCRLLLGTLSDDLRGDSISWLNI